MGLSKENIELFLEPLKFKRRKLAVKSDWKSKNSGNVQNLVFLSQLEAFSRRNPGFFSDIPKGSKLALGRTGFSERTAQIIQNR